MQLRAVFVATSLCFVYSLSFAADAPLGSLTKQLSEGSSNDRIAAAQKLGELGPKAAPAVPALIKSLEGDDLPLQHEAVQALGHINSNPELVIPALARLLENKSPLLRHVAIESLQMYGADALPVLPQLKKLLDDKEAFVKNEAARAVIQISSEPPEKLTSAIAVLVGGLSHESPGINQAAVQGLVAAGAPAVPAVQKLLTSPQPVVVIHACDTLAMIGPASSGAVGPLLNLAEAKNLDVRWHALRALGAIGTKPDKVVPVLVKELQSESPLIRMHSALALGDLGSAAVPAVPELIIGLKDKDESVRRAAASSLGKIGPDAGKAVPQLVAALDDASGAVTLDAVSALGKIGKASVPALVEKLKKPGFQLLIAAVLEEMGPDASGAVPDLVGLISSENPEVRREAILALASIGPAAEPAVPELIKTVKNQKSDVGPAAAYALGRIGTKQAAPVLKDSLEAPNNPLLRLASVWSLLQLYPNNEEYIRIAVPRLAEALSSDRPRVRREAATSLGKIGAKAKDAVPALQKSLKDEDPEVRMESLVALAEIGPTPAMNEIAILLQGPDPAFVPVACYAMGQMGAAAKDAVPVLRRLLQSRDSAEKTVAAWALVKIDPNPETIKSAIPLLATAVTKSGRPEIRVVAARTLGEIGAGSQEARTALLSAKTDDDESVRKAADLALTHVK